MASSSDVTTVDHQQQQQQQRALALEFLDRSLLAVLLGTNGSRWKALISRLAGNTQKAQKLETSCGMDKLLLAVDDDFQLAHQLLQTEHAMFREGFTLCSDVNATSDHHLLGGTSGSPSDPVWRNEMRDMLQSCLLVDLAMKESMLSHWKEEWLDISPDTLRVYCHSFIARPTLPEDVVRRTMSIVSPAALLSTVPRR